MAGGRQGLIDEIADAVAAVRQARPVLVGVDGVDGAGKTVFADELADALRGRRRAVVRAGVDSFHHPRAVRWRRGRESPEGYFRDSYDYPLLRRVLLDPIRSGGHYRVAAFDHATDSVVDAALEVAPEQAVLVFDGIFLHRPELRRYWDYSVFLQVGFDVSVPRCAQRDGSEPDPAAARNRRYVEGQRLYFAECEPERHATVVVDNTELAAPFVVTR